MFWRLFLTYLLLVTAAVGLVGGIVLRRNEGEDLFLELAREVVTAAAAIVLVSVIPAYLLARRFTRPLDGLTHGAERLADGDLGHKIYVAGGKEFAALARTFNGMSDRLAATFAQLEHDREQLRTILSGMVEGVVAIDNDQRVLFANETAGRLLEFAPAAAVGRKLWEVTRQRVVQEIVETALTGAGPHRREIDWTGPVVRNLAVYVSRLPGPASPGAVLVLHDTTELRRLERLRQDFVANVSHELKTPLAVIQSNIEALVDGAADDPAARGPFLERVSHEAVRLEALIQDLLRLARIESGQQLLEPGPVPLDAAIAACLDRHATRAEAKTLSFVEVPPADAPADLAAWADEEAVGQILDNLVDNAIKYTRNGGRITVRWAAAGRHVRVEVEDTGIGIPARDLPRVFERFYRVDVARSRSMGGTGLGLAIVKHLAQAMNGTVTVASEVGKGTTFAVTLPRADGQAG
jgi:two-component system phosphate regulon sensor histidine kinase PhoR